jgi:hypothetical protein
MARKQRNDIDYFPHSVNHGKKMFYLRSKYKNDGYAVWFLLLEELGKANNHYLDLKDAVSRMYLSSSFMLEEDHLMEIIQDLVKFKEFDAELLQKESIIFNQNFVDSIEDAYKKRVNQCVTKTSLIDDLKVIGRWIEPKKAEKPSNPSRIGDGNPQSIVKDIKVDEIKPKKSKENTESKFSFRKSLSEIGVEDLIITDWLKVRKNKKATNSQTAFNAISKEITKSGKDANTIIKTCVENSWSGFKTEWLKTLQNGNNSGNTSKDASSTHYKRSETKYDY